MTPEDTAAKALAELPHPARVMCGFAMQLERVRVLMAQRNLAANRLKALDNELRHAQTMLGKMTKEIAE